MSPFQGASVHAPCVRAGRASEGDLLIGVDGADVGQLLLADWVDFKVRLPGTLPHHLQRSSPSAPAQWYIHVSP